MRSARPLTIVLLAACAAVIAPQGDLTAVLPPPTARELLRSVGEFTDAEWAAVERGESVARLLDTDRREIAVIGAVRIAAPREALIARYRNIENLKTSSIVLDASRLEAPPTPSDLMRVPLEDYSLDLRECRTGDCPVRLSDDAVRRFHRDVDWRNPEWRSQSAAVWREVLASYVSAYVAGGRKALPSYVNKEVPLSVASELSLLLREYRFVAAYSPEFHAYLQEFGSPAPAGSEQTLYWTKEDFGVRPILRISHQIVYRIEHPRPAAIIATNQVYADHYLDAAVGLTLAISATDRGAEGGFYMIAVNRARTRSLGGFFRQFVRSTVQGRSRDGMRKMLTTTKAALEKRGGR